MNLALLNIILYIYLNTLVIIFCYYYVKALLLYRLCKLYVESLLIF